MSLRWLIVGFMALLSLHGSAQPLVRQVYGTIIDSVKRMPLKGASIILISPKDTLTAITNPQGRFTFDRVKDSLGRLEISYLGYRNVSRQIRFKSKTLQIDTITMAPSAYMLEEVTIQGERPLMGQRGDTIVFHAEAIRVLPGDETMELVTRLPGVVIKDGTITFMGKTIERTYVDKKPLFGEGVDVALKYLEAHDVINIEVYDELVEEDKIQGRVNGKKRTVLNLVTRSKPEKSNNLRAHAGYGATIDPDGFGQLNSRYNVNGSYNYFSEQQSFGFRGYSNNDNQGEGFRKTTGAGLNFSRRWTDKAFLDGNYSFNDSYNSSQNITQKIYFPTDKYRSRRNDDTSRTNNAARNHNVGINFRYNAKQDVIYFNPQIQFSSGNSESYRGALSLQDEQVINRVATIRRNKTNRYNFGETLSWTHAFHQARHTLSVSLNSNLSQNHGNGWQIDTLTAENGRKFLQNNNNGWKRSADADIGYSVRIKEFNSIGVNAGLSYDNSHSKRLAIDQYTGKIDSTLTNDYTRNYTTLNYAVQYNRNTEKMNLTMRMGYQTSTLNKEELFPELLKDRVMFNSLRPSLFFSYNISSTRQVYVHYGTSSQQPSVEQLRNKLNYQNPLSLRGGNPNLQQSFTQSVQLSYNSNQPKTARTFNAHISASVSRKEIATRQIYFAEDTPLPQYNNYIAVKGSTLTLPVNVNGGSSMQGGVSLSQLIKPLQGTLSVGASCSFNRRPSYIGTLLNYTNTLSPQMNLSFNSTQSVVYQLTLYTSLAYNHSVNSLKTGNNILNHQTSASLTINFLKKLYLTTHYSFSMYHNFTYTDGDVNTHTLSLKVGCKFFKKRALDVNLTLSDLLLRTDNFSSRTMSDYLLNTWTQRAGRYFMFNVSYRFNKTGKLSKKSTMPDVREKIIGS